MSIVIVDIHESGRFRIEYFHDPRDSQRSHQSHGGTHSEIELMPRLGHTIGSTLNRQPRNLEIIEQRGNGHAA